jgi:hypothetical protein
MQPHKARSVWLTLYSGIDFKLFQNAMLFGFEFEEQRSYG